MQPTQPKRSSKRRRRRAGRTTRRRRRNSFNIADHVLARVKRTLFLAPWTTKEQGAVNWYEAVTGALGTIAPVFLKMIIKTITSTQLEAVYPGATTGIPIGSIMTIAIRVDDLIATSPFAYDTGTKINFRSAKVNRVTAKFDSSTQVSNRGGLLTAAIIPTNFMNVIRAENFKPDYTSFEDIKRLPGAVTHRAGRAFSVTFKPKLNDVASSWLDITSAYDVVAYLAVGYQDLSATSAADVIGKYQPDEFMCNITYDADVELRVPKTGVSINPKITYYMDYKTTGVHHNGAFFDVPSTCVKLTDDGMFLAISDPDWEVVSSPGVMAD